MNGRREYPARQTAANASTIFVQVIADGSSIIIMVATLFFVFLELPDSILGQADVSGVTLGAISKTVRCASLAKGDGASAGQA